jgi:cyanate permease
MMLHWSTLILLLHVPHLAVFSIDIRVVMLPGLLKGTETKQSDLLYTVFQYKI